MFLYYVNYLSPPFPTKKTLLLLLIWRQQDKNKFLKYHYFATEGF